jgi:hypothetical protein
MNAFFLYGEHLTMEQFGGKRSPRSKESAGSGRISRRFILW